MTPRAVYLRFAALLVALAMLAPGVGAAPALQAPSGAVTAGFYQLSWDSTASRYELEEASGPGFADSRLLYAGPDTATVLSGRENGRYYYRIRGVDEAGAAGPWSEAAVVEVRHHPLSRALGFFVVGLIVFAALVVAIRRGEREA
jgi:hypothetical protein